MVCRMARMRRPTPNYGEDEDQKDSRAFHFGRLSQEEIRHGHRDGVPENCEDPSGNCTAARLAVGLALGPVFAPKPRFGGVFDLKPLLPLQQLRAIEGGKNQSDADHHEEGADEKQRPDRGMALV